MMGLMFFGLLGTGILVTALLDDSDAGDDEPDAEPAGPLSPAPGELIEGTEGPDTIDGTPGDDRIFAQGGDDVIDAGAGDDRVFADGGFDVIFGGPGNDFLRGGADDDLILPEAGNDTVYGDTGDDIIDAADVIDTDMLKSLIASGGIGDTDVTDLADFDRATDEADTVNGGEGADFILFGDNDEVTGGNGADTFGTGFWASPDAPATITDFDPAEDVLLYGVKGDAFPFIAFAEEDDGTAVLQVDELTVVRLPGVDFFDLGPENLFLLGIPLPGQI